MKDGQEGTGLAGKARYNSVNGLLPLGFGLGHGSL
jgi:hypothetical protein